MPALTRRPVLRTSSPAVGLTLATACGAPVAPASSPTSAPVGPTSAPAAANAAPAATAAPPASASVKMPTYQPITIAPPDLPGDDKIEAGYFAFPKQLNKTVTETPIK